MSDNNVGDDDEYGWGGDADGDEANYSLRAGNDL